MTIRSRRLAVLLCSSLAVTLAPTAARAEPDGRFRTAAATSSSITDRRGDVKSESGGAATQPEADIVAAGAENRGTELVFTLLVDRPTDPTTTKNWNGATSAGWGLDTTGDNKPDGIEVLMLRRSSRGASVSSCSGAGTRARTSAPAWR